MSEPTKMDICEEKSSDPPKRQYRQKPIPTNSRSKNDDAFRQCIGKNEEADYRAQRTAKFMSKLPSDLSTLNLKTPSDFTLRPTTTVIKRLSLLTTGIDLPISELYYRSQESLRNANSLIY